METENKTMSRLVGLAVTLTVAIIMIASLVIPTIQDVDFNRVTFNNNATNYNHSVSNDEVDYTISFDGTSVIYAEDGVNTTFLITSRENFVIASDAFVVIQNYSSSSVISSNLAAYAYVFNETGSNAGFISASVLENYTISYDSNLKTFTVYNGSTIIYTIPVTWQYHMSPTGLYRTFQTTQSWYALDSDLQVAGGGWYSTGDNDTTYGFFAFNQATDLTVGSAYADDSKVIVSSESVRAGISKITVSVQVGDEEFTPWNVIIPKTVTSIDHTDWENLYWTIPVLLIIALLVMVVNSYRAKNE